MRTAPAELELGERVTTLATLVKIRRRDGQYLRWTSHDRTIVFAGQSFKPAIGYRGKALAHSASLSVGNSEFDGVIRDDEIDPNDLAAGLYNNAEVWVSWVNWRNPAAEMGLKKYRFGEVKRTDRGVFTVELRDIKQILQQPCMKVYQIQCRHDLGDNFCQVPLWPALVGRNALVTEGQYRRVATLSPASTTFSQILNNGGFELDTAGDGLTTIKGWSGAGSKWDIKSGTVEGLAPYAGNQYLRGGSVASGTITQTVNLGQIGIDEADIDAGLVDISFSGRRANSDVNDLGRIKIEFLEATATGQAGDVISTPYDSGLEAIAPLDTWVGRSMAATTAPVGTRFVRVTLEHSRVSGSPSNAAFDGLALSAAVAAGNSYTPVYENRIYKVVTTGVTAAVQPAYDTTVGNQTTDGAAVLEAVQAWTRDAIISAVISEKVLEIDVTDLRDEDDWFTEGKITFESGPYAGLPFEIKNWVAATKRATMLLDFGFQPLVGQKIRIHPGCLKRLRPDCRDKFDNVVNNGGFEFAPGAHEVLDYPDQT